MTVEKRHKGFNLYNVDFKDVVSELAIHAESEMMRGPLQGFMFSCFCILVQSARRRR